MTYETLAFENRAGIGVLTLNRPERLNAINKTMVDELNALLDAIERDEVRRNGSQRGTMALTQGIMEPQARTVTSSPRLARSMARRP